MNADPPSSMFATILDRFTTLTLQSATTPDKRDVDSRVDLLDANGQWPLGCLTENRALIDEAREKIVAEIRITTGEGVQPDSRFHQHGAMLHSGGYGTPFLTETAAVT